MKISLTITFEIDGGRNVLSRFSWDRVKKHIARRDKYTCQYCGEIAKSGQVDHRIPLSRGGTDDFSNLAWACPECNLSKADMTLEEWQFTKAAQAEQETTPSPAASDPAQPERLHGATADQVRQVCELSAAGQSGTAIEAAVFGFTGGAAYRKVKAILADPAAAGWAGE